MASRAPIRQLKTMEELVKADRETILNEARAISKRVSQQSWRIRKQYNKYSGALMNLLDAGGMSINKKMSRNELLHEVKKGLDFLGAESSTIRGIKNVEKKVEKGLKGQNVDIEDWNDFQKKRFFRAFEQLAKNNPGVANKQYKYEVMERLSEIQVQNKRRGVEWLVSQMEQELDNIMMEKSAKMFPEDAFNARI